MTSPAAGEEVAPAMTRKQKILQRTRVGAGLTFGVAALLWASSLSFGTALTIVLVTFLACWAVFEVDRMELFHSRGAVVGAYAAALGASSCALWLHGHPGAAARELTWSTYPSSTSLLRVLGAGLVTGTVAAIVGRFTTGGAKRGGRAPVATWILFLLVPLPMFALAPIRFLGGTTALAAFIALAKIGDIAGYYFGNWLGKTRPFKNISPGKTTAGCVASLVAGTLVGGGLVVFGVLDTPRFGVISGLLLGAVVNLTAQAGDLTESALKRRADVKDSGTFFGPSGGLFDLVDSLILAAPAAAFVWPLLFD